MSKDTVFAEDGRAEPDIFASYERKVAEMLSQESQSSEISERKHGEFSSFTDCVGAGMSDRRREVLEICLRQCVKALTPEVDNMLDPVLAMCQLQSLLKRQKAPSNDDAATEDDAEGSPSKKCRKVCVSPDPANPVASAAFYKDADLKYFMENDRLQFEEILKKYSDELYLTLENMEQQLEKLLETVAAKCRPATLDEKRTLRTLMLELPSKNLDRVAQIVSHNKASEIESSDEIFVDLNQLDTTTFWRLYFYVGAVENARRLAR